MANDTGVPTMKIFYGPPGTGKTYWAAREAVRIIDGVLPDANSFQERHQQLIAAQRIWWVTFHPSFSYEDFVEGFRPVKIDNHLVYETQDGPFKLACEACKVFSPVAALRLGEKVDRYEIVHVDPSGVVLKSKVDRKDAVTPEILQYADFWTIERLRSAGLTPDSLRIPGKDYDKREAVARATQLPTTVLTNSSQYAALWDFLDKKREIKGDHPVVLVIDEINRADLSRVLGELILLLEVDKREGASESRSVILPYSKKPFSVPASLSVLGTMNTTDRSIALVDMALRRRFEFEELNPDPSLCVNNYCGIDLQLLLRRWNERITALRSRDHRLGHSDFMSQSLDRVRLSHAWSDDEDGCLRALARVVRSKTLPLLVEYFHEDWRKVDAVLGRVGLLRAETYANVQDLVEDIVDLSDTTSYVAEDWWDPLNSSWNSDKFKSALAQTYGDS